MAVYDVKTRDATGVSDVQANLSGEVTALDKDVIDAVCGFFEYGTNSDLSDATRTSGEKDVGVFADGGDVYGINLTGLDASTTYYYKAKGRMIRYNDDDSLAYVNDRTKFLRGAAQNIESGLWDNALPDTTHRSNLFSTHERIGFALANGNAKNNLWNSSTVSEDCWDKADTGGLSGSGPHFKYDVDLSFVSTLEIEIRASASGVYVIVDGNTLLHYTEREEAWLTYTFDISGYSGICEVKVQFSDYEMTLSYVSNTLGGSAFRFAYANYTDYGDVGYIELIH